MNNNTKSKRGKVAVEWKPAGVPVMGPFYREVEADMRRRRGTPAGRAERDKLACGRKVPVSPIRPAYGFQQLTPDMMKVLMKSDFFAGGQDGSWRWNGFNLVFQCHSTGRIDLRRTNWERWKRGLPIPWNPRLGEMELLSPDYKPVP